MTASEAAPVREQHHFVAAVDGLTLHAAEFGIAQGELLPVVCLPGLARTTEDFRELAVELAHEGRRVLALDYRGRGRSEYDNDPSHYTPAIELRDILTVLDALKVGPAAFVGTSRGGILTMLLAATDRGRIAGAMLNDIGPVIDMAGLLRIKGYVGKLPRPKDWTDAADILKGLFSAQFPKLSDAEWRHAAGLTWHEARHEDGGRLVLNYDSALSHTLDDLRADTLVPALWQPFDALADVPVMVIRGLLSDLLSAATVEAMTARRPSIEVVEVPDQGHPPSLASDAMIGRIAGFIAQCDAATRRA